MPWVSNSSGLGRLVDSEQWRNCVTILEQEDSATKGKPRLLSLHDEDPFRNPPEQPIKLDEAVRTWDKDGSFKKELSKYYTQFYHKTDKVHPPRRDIGVSAVLTRYTGWSTMLLREARGRRFRKAQTGKIYERQDDPQLGC